MSNKGVYTVQMTLKKNSKTMIQNVKIKEK